MGTWEWHRGKSRAEEMSLSWPVGELQGAWGKRWGPSEDVLPSPPSLGCMEVGGSRPAPPTEQPPGVWWGSVAICASRVSIPRTTGRSN